MCAVKYLIFDILSLDDKKEEIKQSDFHMEFYITSTPKQ